MDGIKAKKLHDEIIEKVAEYYETVHAPAQNAPFVAGKSRVNYAGRVFDAAEMTNLADAALEFWLTSGRYTKEFEKKTGGASGGEIRADGQLRQFGKFAGIFSIDLAASGREKNQKRR